MYMMGIGEIGYNTFELIPAVLTFFQSQMFKLLLNGVVWDFKYAPSAATVCLLLKGAELLTPSAAHQFPSLGKIKR